jgi:hypothetical protein
MPLTGVLAVTAGKFWHRFFQLLWLRTGDLLQDEVPIWHEETNRVGHADGLLPSGEGLEIKCMIPSTLLERPDGGRSFAAEIRAGDFVIGWDESTHASVPVRVIDQWDNGIQPTYTVDTVEGKTLVVTGNHPFLTERGWIRADSLAVHDRVRVGDIPRWATEMKCLDPEEAHALGVLVGDGGLTGQVMYLTSADLDIVERMKSYALNHGAELVETTNKYVYRFRVPRQQARSIGNPILNRLREQGLAGCSSHTKRVPPAVWQGGPEAWRQFLSGYFDADGTVITMRTGTYSYVSWGSVNKDLLLDCQILLARLGVRSSVVSQMGKYLGKPHQSWKLMVRDSRSVVQLREVLDLWCERKRDDLASLQPKLAKIGHARTAVFGWDRIKSVTRGLSMPTVGIQVENGTHFTNGVVTHNTINEFQINKVTSEEVLKEKKYQYWCQTQDYLDCMGWDAMRYFLMNPSYPFPMAEFVVPADKAYQAKRRGEYMRAIEMAQKYPSGDLLADLQQVQVHACCAPGSKDAAKCPTRLACPIGRFGL